METAVSSSLWDSVCIDKTQDTMVVMLSHMLASNADEQKESGNGQHKYAPEQY